MISTTTPLPRQRGERAGGPVGSAQDAVGDPAQRPSGRPAESRVDRPADGPATGSLAFRGLLHDLGHGLATLALLVEAVDRPAATSAAASTAESAGPGDLLDLLGVETARLLAVVHTGLCGLAAGEPLALRGVLEQIAAVAAHTRSTVVTVDQGPDVVVSVDLSLLWRVVSNVVDNAVRAAGPTGSVRLRVAADEVGGAVIDVVDDGPGFPCGPLRAGHLGLAVVANLLDLCGGTLDIRDAPRHGAWVRIGLPATVARDEVA